MGAILESFQNILQNPLDALVALFFLSVMEIVLGIDNIVFISILTGRLPEDQQPNARRLGLGLALIMRIALLFSISAVMQLDDPLFELEGAGVFTSWLAGHEEVNEISIRDLILLCGGLFLVWKATLEIHREVEGVEHDTHGAKAVSFTGVLVQIALMDIIFSLDSVITAVGMTDQLAVMVVAVILAIAVMIIFAEKVSHFVHRHPTLKMLALSFLVLIGVMLTAEGTGIHVPKGYIYFAMTFSVIVEMLNTRLRLRRLRTKEELAAEHG
ncbi:MAG: TerC family protein [Planctomycetes bacterium]|nr:TerC family protein [Planctomycetota bacterium]